MLHFDDWKIFNFHKFTTLMLRNSKGTQQTMNAARLHDSTIFSWYKYTFSIRYLVTPWLNRLRSTPAAGFEKDARGFTRGYQQRNLQERADRVIGWRSVTRWRLGCQFETSAWHDKTLSKWKLQWTTAGCPPLIFPFIFMQGKLVLWVAANKIMCGLPRASSILCILLAKIEMQKLGFLYALSTTLEQYGNFYFISRYLYSSIPLCPVWFSPAYF